MKHLSFVTVFLLRALLPLYSVQGEGMILINGIPVIEAGDIRYIVLVAVACIVYWLLWKKDRDRREK